MKRFAETCGERVSFRRLARFVGILAVLLLVGLSDSALAHKPEQIGGVADGRTPETAREIENPQVSQVFYSELRAQDQIDYRKFSGERGDNVLVQLGVPKIERLENFRPQAVLLGSSLPSAPEGLPVEVPEGMGAVKVGFQEDATPGEFFEPFSMTRSWVATEYTDTLPATGEYYVAVFDPSGEPGKYWLAVGRQERFGPADWVTLPVKLWQVRVFHEVTPLPVLIIPLAALAILGVIAYFLYALLIRRVLRTRKR